MTPCALNRTHKTDFELDSEEMSAYSLMNKFWSFPVVVVVEDVVVVVVDLAANLLDPIFVVNLFFH